MSPDVMRKLAKPMLFAAALIWGTSFFIMKNALDSLPVYALLAIRFTAGAILLSVVCLKKWKNLEESTLKCPPSKALNNAKFKMQNAK